jgi:hypothetical protein
VLPLRHLKEEEAAVEASEGQATDESHGQGSYAAVGFLLVA